MESESIRIILSRNLHDLRKKKGLSQAELAERAGFQHNSYNRWETGKSWPEPDTIAALARALGVPESRLFQNYDSQNISPEELPIAHPSKKEITKKLKEVIDLINS